MSGSVVRFLVVVICKHCSTPVADVRIFALPDGPTHVREDARGPVVTTTRKAGPGRLAAAQQWADGEGRRPRVPMDDQHQLVLNGVSASSIGAWCDRCGEIDIPTSALRHEAAAVQNDPRATATRMRVHRA